MTRNLSRKFGAMAFVLALSSGAIFAADMSTRVFGGLADTAPRSIFQDIQDRAPRSVFEDLRDTAPHKGRPFGTVGDTAP